MDKIRPDELYHYGRKGMKWGMNIFGKIKTNRLNKQRSENLKKARAAKAERRSKISSDRMSPKKMTDKELQERIDRLSLEKKYKDAVRESRSAQSRGKRFLDKFLDFTVDKVAENAAADVVAQAMKVLVVKGTNMMFDDEVVFTNNKKK